MTLSIISHEKGPVTARPPPHGMGPDSPPMDFSHMMNPSIMATHTFEDAPPLDILLVPGGLGNFALLEAGDDKIEDFIASRFESLDYLLSVCIGSVSLARAGVLNNRRATSNKGAWQWVTGSGFGINVTWVPEARWVQDGKVWTSSGVAAGMDMAYAFLRHIYPPQQVDEMANGIEYAPHTDPHWDPFAVVHKVRNAPCFRTTLSHGLVSNSFPLTLQTINLLHFPTMRLSRSETAHR